MSEEKLPPCKECGDTPGWADEGLVYHCIVSPNAHTLTDCSYATGDAMPPKIWRLIHTPDPRLAELRSQVHELEKLLEESHVVAAALDTELRAMKAKHTAGEYYTTPAIWDTITAAAESQAMFDHVVATKPED